MKTLLVILVLLGSMVGFVRGDPNIYGPGGVNLGPNGNPEQLLQNLQQDKAMKEERERTKLLQQQVQQLQQQVQQLQQQLWQQQQMLKNQQNQSWIQIQIPNGYNYGYQPYGNIGWGVSNFRDGSFNKGHGWDGRHERENGHVRSGGHDRH
jgi:hypothetical protein